MPNEFPINTYAGQWQQHPDVTRLTDGSLVVVWDSLYSERNGQFYYIAAQRFSATGEPIGGELVLDADLAGQSTNPSIVALADGGFAVAWESAKGDFVSGQTDVWTRAFDADGTPRGASVVVHPPSKQEQYAASVTATADGYAVSWTSYGGGKIARWDDVYLRPYDSDGQPLGDGVKVDQVTRFDQNNSKTITLADGRILVAWQSADTGDANPGATADAIRGRFYDADGRALGDEFTVAPVYDALPDGSGYTASSYDVAALPGGGFVSTWYRTDLPNRGDLTYKVLAQVHAADGSPIGRELTVSASTEDIPAAHTVAVLDDGGFVVAWHGYGPRNGNYEEVWARVYDAEGHPLGRAFIANPPSGATSQELPQVQAMDGGGFMMVYESEGLDGDDDGIAGRIFGQGTGGNDADAMTWTGTWHAFAGDDVVVGTDGRDTIYGDAGDDAIAGLGGADRLAGGKGADLFAYFAAADSRAGAADTIAAFESGRDTIDLSRLDGAFTWIGRAAFGGHAGELRFANGALSADLDGDRVADLVVKVTGDPVTQSDLIL